MAYAQDDESIVDVCNRLLGSEIEEIEVDADEQVVYIHTSTGMIKINGEDLSMWVECERYAS
jgi:hypothetical protein